MLGSNRFYQKKFAAAGLKRDDIRSAADLSRLPFTTKEELLSDQEESPPYGSNLTFPREQYCRLHQTSGTSGRRLRWLDTPDSWNWFMECWGQIYSAVGLLESDRLFFPFSFGPFLGFWAAFEGAGRLGRFVLPGGGMSTVARLRFLIEHQMTFVLCTPTYALHMAETARDEGIDLAGSTIRGLVLAGEPGASIPATRRILETEWNARVFDHSGMTEFGSVGIEFAQFPSKLFLLEDQAIAEFIDPATGAAVAEGETGEMVLTNLGRWGSPLLRYRTGDLVRWRCDVSPEGLPFVYLEGGIIGRADDMIWIRGNNVYPSTIETIVREFAGVAEFAIESVETSNLASLTVIIEPTAEVAADSQRTRSLLADIGKEIQDRLYFRPDISLAEVGSLPRHEMKARRLTRRKE